MEYTYKHVPQSGDLIICKCCYKPLLYSKYDLNSHSLIRINDFVDLNKFYSAGSQLSCNHCGVSLFDPNRKLCILEESIVLDKGLFK